MGGDNGMSDMNGGMGMPDMGGGCSAAEKACNDNSNCTRLRSLAFPNHVGEQNDANSGGSARVGESCTDDKDCASGTCGSDSKCEAVADDNASGSTRVGESCTDDKDCASGTCGSDSKCEAAGGGRRRESGEETDESGGD